MEKEELLLKYVFWIYVVYTVEDPFICYHYSFCKLMACKINIYVELRKWNVKSYKLCSSHYSVHILNFIQERNNLISQLSTRLYGFFAKI